MKGRKLQHYPGYKQALFVIRNHGLRRLLMLTMFFISAIVVTIEISNWWSGKLARSQRIARHGTQPFYVEPLPGDASYKHQFQCFRTNIPTYMVISPPPQTVPWVHDLYSDAATLIDAPTDLKTLRKASREQALSEYDAQKYVGFLNAFELALEEVERTNATAALFLDDETSFFPSCLWPTSLDALVGNADLRYPGWQVIQLGWAHKLYETRAEWKAAVAEILRDWDDDEAMGLGRTHGYWSQFAPVPLLAEPLVRQDHDSPTFTRAMSPALLLSKSGLERVLQYHLLEREDDDAGEEEALPRWRCGDERKIGTQALNVSVDLKVKQTTQQLCDIRAFPVADIFSDRGEILQSTPPFFSSTVNKLRRYKRNELEDWRMAAHAGMGMYWLLSLTEAFQPPFPFRKKSQGRLFWSADLIDSTGQPRSGAQFWSSVQLL